VSETPGCARGACLCGAVTFVATFPTNWVAHCHCTMCQREHGAAFVTWVSVPSEQFQLNDAQGVLHTYPSSPGAMRQFCGRCGSSLFFRSDNWPGEVHVARANFFDPLDRAPAMHGFYDTHVDWFAVNDDLPRKPAPSA
jgi:hypothetical protein